MPPDRIASGIRQISKFLRLWARNWDTGARGGPGTKVSASVFEQHILRDRDRRGAPVTSGGFQVVAPHDRSKPISILIVEDEALIASYIEDVLGESGFRIAGIVSSGPEALSVAAENTPDLALVDIRLTGPIDGIELACQLRQKFAVPAIFLSGLLDAATTERAQAAHPLGFLAKPFLPSQVFNAIQRALDLP